MRAELETWMRRTSSTGLRAAGLLPVLAALVGCGGVVGCSFATDLDTGAVEALQCDATRPCPSGWECGDNGYCYALDAGGDLDTGSVDTTPGDTTGMDTAGVDTAGVDTSGQDTVGMDTTGSDTAGTDTTAQDTTATDTAGGCTGGQTDCGGTCVDLQTSEAHCGNCNNGCPTGETCVNGACTSGCPGTQQRCNGTCVETATDVNHCGGCGQVCATGVDGGLCIAGTCRCQNASGPQCYDTAPDVASAACDKRNCSLTCQAGRANCNNDTADGCEAAAPCP